MTLRADDRVSPSSWVLQGDVLHGHLHLSTFDTSSVVAISCVTYGGFMAGVLSGVDDYPGMGWFAPHEELVTEKHTWEGVVSSTISIGETKLSGNIEAFSQAMLRYWAFLCGQVRV